MPDHVNPVVRRFIEDAGNTTQSFGFGRVVGQIYAYLYFSEEPHSLADMEEALAISKGSASTGVRQLEQWDGVRKVWLRGDRKDYYVANDWLGKLFKNILTDVAAKKMNSYSSLLDDVEDDLDELERNNGDISFIKERIDNLRNFQNKVQSVWGNPIVQTILK